MINKLRKIEIIIKLEIVQQINGMNYNDLYRKTIQEQRRNFKVMVEKFFIFKKKKLFNLQNIIKMKSTNFQY